MSDSTGTAGFSRNRASHQCESASDSDRHARDTSDLCSLLSFGNFETVRSIQNTQQTSRKTVP
jgi:hypothetical protein